MPANDCVACNGTGYISGGKLCECVAREQGMIDEQPALDNEAITAKYAAQLDALMPAKANELKRYDSPPGDHRGMIPDQYGDWCWADDADAVIAALREKIRGLDEIVREAAGIISNVYDDDDSIGIGDSFHKIKAREISGRRRELMRDV